MRKNQYNFQNWKLKNEIVIERDLNDRRLSKKVTKLVCGTRFELGLEKPEPKRAIQSALTIAISYILGGLVPLIPYMFFPKASEAVVASVALTLVALLVFGYAKGYFTGNKPIMSAVQTALIGAIASSAAFGMAKAVQPHQP